MVRTPQVDGAPYVECDGCGHPIENHGAKGCGYQFDEYRCPCDTAWTRDEKRTARKHVGLPTTWTGEEF